MAHGLKAFRRHVKNTSQSWEKRLRASRVVLVLTLLLVAVMPVTEHFWTWDHFMQGGHDVEFSLLTVLVFCGLVVLIAHQMVGTSSILLLIIAHHLKAPPIGRLINLAIGTIAGLLIDCSSGDRLFYLCVPLRATPLRI